jgi:hypothetical protein
MSDKPKQAIGHGTPVPKPETDPVKTKAALDAARLNLEAARHATASGLRADYWAAHAAERTFAARLEEHRQAETNAKLQAHAERVAADQAAAAAAEAERLERWKASQKPIPGRLGGGFTNGPI